MKRSFCSTHASTVGEKPPAGLTPTFARWPAGTHMPFVRLAHGRLVINPGSIGMPYGRAGAHWALLGPGVELRSTAFDIEAAITQDSAETVRPAAA